MTGGCLFQFAGLQSPQRLSPKLKRKQRYGGGRSRELEVGKAAEHLVCADLLMRGHNAFLSDQGLPYDVIVDLGSCILRLQVKGTRQPKNPMPFKRVSDGYFFQIRRAGKGSKRLYGDDEFDVYALVALDIRTIAYFAKCNLGTQTVCLRVPGLRYGQGGRMARYFEDASFEQVLRDLAVSRPID
jgi:hypothetical protein